MKRFDSFLAINILIIAVLSYVYYYANTSLDHFANNPNLQAQLKRSQELKLLQADLNEINRKNKSLSRGLASIKKTSTESLFVASSALDTNEVARVIYSKAKEACYKPYAEMDCINHIDTLVTQFPESIWAGESLLLLSEIYLKNNKSSQALDLIKLLKVEFHQFKSIQAKVEYLENQKL